MDLGVIVYCLSVVWKTCECVSVCVWPNVREIA